MSDLSPISQAWLDTLSAIHVRFNPGQLKNHWANVEFRSSIHRAVQMFSLDWHGKAFEPVDSATLVVSYPPWLCDLPLIEQREILLWLFCLVTEKFETQGLISFASSKLADAWAAQHHCWHSNVVAVDTRWRYLAKRMDLKELWYGDLETRPVCKICSSRVATGAGFDSFKDLWDTSEPYPNEPVERILRPDVHHECMRYAKLILVPGIKEARRQMAEEAAKNIDR